MMQMHFVYSQIICKYLDQTWQLQSLTILCIRRPRWIRINAFPHSCSYCTMCKHW